jgi:hypothetical protein
MCNTRSLSRNYAMGGTSKYIVGIATQSIRLKNGVVNSTHAAKLARSLIYSTLTIVLSTLYIYYISIGSVGKRIIVMCQCNLWTGHGRNFMGLWYVDIIITNSHPQTQQRQVEEGSSLIAHIWSCFLSFSLSLSLGMTDGRNNMNIEHYIYRSQTSPSRPAFFGFGMKGREDILKRLEGMGLTILYELDTIYKNILAEMPKCDGMSPSDIDAMPTMVRECRCTITEGIAGGQPVCQEEKWSDYGNATCQTRKFRVSWHPGWYVRVSVRMI